MELMFSSSVSWQESERMPEVDTQLIRRAVMPEKSIFALVIAKAYDDALAGIGCTSSERRDAHSFFYDWRLAAYAHPLDWSVEAVRRDYEVQRAAVRAGGRWDNGTVKMPDGSCTRASFFAYYEPKRTGEDDGEVAA